MMYSVRMLGNVVRLTPSFFFPIFERRNPYDHDEIHIQPQKPQTGMDRVKQMFSSNEYDEHSIELHSVVQASLCGCFVGACIGGFVRSKSAYIYFIENNQATIFKSTREAQKRLQNYVTVAFAKGACEWGWRLGFFTGIFSLVTTTISVYQGNTSLIQYIAAGTLTGALFKMNLGLAATVVGACLGAALSTFSGLAVIGVLKITGLEMADIRRALYKIKQSREDNYRQAQEKASDIKNDPLTIHHDTVIAETGAKKIEEI